MSTKTLQIIGGQRFVQPDWNVTDHTSPLYIKNKPNIPSNFTGSYYDLTDTPDLSVYEISENRKIISGVVIPAASWVGTGPYSQTLTIDSATASTKFDIQADIDTMSTILNNGYCMSIKNDNGLITIYAIGAKPSVDLNVQFLLTEVFNESGDPIWGAPLIGSSSSSSGGFVISTVAPENTNVLWIDTANGLKYHNGSDWVTVPVAYN